MWEQFLKGAYQANIYPIFCVWYQFAAFKTECYQR